MQITGKLTRKAGNGKGFKIEGNDNWLNATDIVVPYLAKLNVGDEVVVDYTKKGVKQEVTKIAKLTSKPELKCKECGAQLKDDKYETCYACARVKGQKPGKTYTNQSKTYDNPERTAQIQRGNALNAAASVLTGRQDDPETIAEMTIVVAERFLEWLRAE